MSVYYMSIFRMSSNVVHELEKCQRNFLWDGGMGKKDHLIKWEEVCKHQKFGRLGIGKLKERNIALLRKWLWHFPIEIGNLWQSTISSKYGHHLDGWDVNPSSSRFTSLIWKNIISVFPSFFHNTRFFVGNGASIRFWLDL